MLFVADLAQVSIHTPTKGVTNKVVYVPPVYEVSIHTPTKGVTSVEEGINTLKCVSIHTPTKGVTIFCCIPIESSSGFNPHTHEGCDFFICLLSS